MDNLRFYDAPSWQDKDVVGSVDVGLGFTIDAKVTVNGSPQYIKYTTVKEQRTM